MESLRRAVVLSSAVTRLEAHWLPWAGRRRMEERDHLFGWFCTRFDDCWRRKDFASSSVGLNWFALLYFAVVPLEDFSLLFSRRNAFLLFAFEKGTLGSRGVHGHVLVC